MPNMMQGRGMMNARGGKAEKVALGPAIKKLVRYCRSYLPFVILAIVLAAMNVFGGYLVTDRMLGMFKSGKREG